MSFEALEAVPVLGELVEYSWQAMSAVLIPGKKDKQADGRSMERLRAHYVVERAIADRLRKASGPEERREIGASMYSELFRQVPDHPRIAAAKGAAAAKRERDIEWNLAQIGPYLRDGCTFLEVGAGDCALASRVSRQAASVYAIDISRQAHASLPENVHFVLTDGRSIDVPADSVDLAFSDQLMEHLHPDDAVEQLRAIHASLKPGGVYVCVTPNRLYGPSDISRYFDDVATCFHLREYTVREVRNLFHEAGFPRTHVYIGARGHFMRCPALLVETFETTLDWLPSPLRRLIARNPLTRALLGVRVAGIKG